MLDQVYQRFDWGDDAVSSLPTTTTRKAESVNRDSSRPSWIAVCLFLLAALTLWPRLVDLAGHSISRATAAPVSPALPTKAIQEIKPGDWVLARAEHGSQVTWKPVNEIYRRRADHLRIVTFRDEQRQLQTLQTTDDHPFWSEKEHDFIPAEELAVGDPVTGADGRSLFLVSTRRDDHPQGIDVYNFQVSDFHTYFAAESDHSTPILVHNSNYHGNDLASTSPNHGHLIFDKNSGELLKFGISSSPISRAGFSYRATNQVNKLRANGIEADSVVVSFFSSRAEAAAWENAAVNAIRRNAKGRTKPRMDSLRLNLRPM